MVRLHLEEYDRIVKEQLHKRQKKKMYPPEWIRKMNEKEMLQKRNTKKYIVVYILSTSALILLPIFPRFTYMLNGHSLEIFSSFAWPFRCAVIAMRRICFDNSDGNFCRKFISLQCLQNAWKPHKSFEDREQRKRLNFNISTSFLFVSSN